MAKYLEQSAGTLVERVAPAASGGAADAGKLPALDPSGRLDASFMPTGIGSDTEVLAATEALAAGDFVNIYDAGGTASVRKADASTTGKEAHGFVLAAVAAGASATVYFEGKNAQVTGQVGGNVYLSAATPGKAVAAAPTGTGKVVQRLGVATSATSINFEPGLAVTLA